ncbi:hypothetical protein VHEMI10745 [[Torrubiella] hemipterigena]|uniref:HTH CENPB-type domain-containing protein n=1 Tax=[Torrubiella] hemipterigena TaxID=1531966 RepID=A0A0A1TJI2_9HYPO|nr:hypothetical protein VHEMI10745 [[Torrubiella] hemipterigena]
MGKTSNEADVISALQAIERDPKLSNREAARIYNIAETTLRRRRNKIPCRADTTSKSRKLTNDEENTIIQYILNLDARAQPPRLRDVEAMANRLLELRHDIPVGRNWVASFIRRHPEVVTRLSRQIDYKRVRCEDPDKYRAWFELVKNTIAKYGIYEADIYNFDETGFAMGVISPEMVVTSSERSQKGRKAQLGNKQWATLIEYISAGGYMIPPFVIVAGKTHLSSWYENSPLPSNWAIGVTENGWNTNERCLDWLYYFQKHESHQSTDFQLYCQQNDIITLCIPSHTLYKLQPLDVACYGPLKQAYNNVISDLMRAYVTYITKEEFFLALYAAHKATMTESNILGGFRGTRLALFNPEYVISQLDTKFSTSSPPRSSDRLELPWLPKTPSNPNEALSQTEYIKKRIRNHRSSSPSDLIENLNQMSKCTTSAIQKMVLMQHRIDELEEANNRLSRQKRVTKRQLQSGGTLTVDSGKI